MPLVFLESRFNLLTGTGSTCRIWKKSPLIYSVRMPNFVLYMLAHGISDTHVIDHYEG